MADWSCSCGEFYAGRVCKPQCVSWRDKIRSGDVITLLPDQEPLTMQDVTPMGENEYQTKAIEYARRLGMQVHRNYMGPGCEVGWPDVEIFAPRGRMVLIEFKQPGKEPRGIQSHRISELRKMGHHVATCYNLEEAKRIIDDLNN